MDRKPRVAQIGGGYWGKNIIRNLHELNALEMICDIDEERLDDYRVKYPKVTCLSSFSDVLETTSIDAVSIATPAVSHYDLAARALRAGKDVFVEKPLALHMAEGEELAELARDNGRILMVGHILRYHPAIEKIKELMDTGQLGRVGYCHSNRLDLGKVRTEENILWSFAPHDISVLLYLIGRPPDEVTCSGEILLQPRIHDLTLTVMKWNSGVTAHINVSWLYPYKEHKLVIVGDRAMLTFDDAKETDKLVLYNRGIDFVKGQPARRDDDRQIVDYDDREPLKLEMEHFLSCVENRENPRTDAAEGLAVLEVLHAAQACLSRDQEPVRDLHKGNYKAHATAVIDPGSSIGDGTRIWHFSHVMPKATIGKNCSLGQNVLVADNVVIGDNCKIQNNVSLYEGVILEDDVFCGPSMVFTNVKNPRSAVPRNTSSDYLETHVKKGASIGANSTIICGVTIGENAFIAAGAVVVNDVKPNRLMAGVPAKQIGWMCDHGYRIKQQGNAYRCTECDNRFELERLDAPGRLRCSRESRV